MKHIMKQLTNVIDHLLIHNVFEYGNKNARDHQVSLSIFKPRPKREYKLSFDIIPSSLSKEQHFIDIEKIFSLSLSLNKSILYVLKKVFVF